MSSAQDILNLDSSKYFHGILQESENNVMLSSRTCMSLLQIMTNILSSRFGGIGEATNPIHYDQTSKNFEIALLDLARSCINDEAETRIRQPYPLERYNAGSLSESTQIKDIYEDPTSMDTVESLQRDINRRIVGRKPELHKRLSYGENVLRQSTFDSAIDVAEGHEGSNNHA